MLERGTEKLCFDSKRMRHARKIRREAQPVAFDAMIADYLLHATHPALSLGTLAGERLHDENPGAAAIVRLYEPMKRELCSKEMDKLYYETELPLVNVLFDMEETGFALDRGVLEDMSVRFHKRIDEMAGEIFKLAGGEFNILSTKQLGSVLFERLGLPAAKKTKTGYSTDSEVLESLYTCTDIRSCSKYRAQKLASTLIDGLMGMVRHDTGRVPYALQSETLLRDLSSTEPNLRITRRRSLGADKARVRRERGLFARDPIIRR